VNKKYRLKSASLPASTAIDYPRELNPEQFAVVTQAEGACLVLAGAGSGKTRTLIYRVSYLLEKGVLPEEILLVTFTNKAAQEMRNRVETLIKTKARGLWCGTFHHIGNRILRMHGRAIPLSEDFGILDEEDSRDLVKVCVKSLGFKAASGESRFPKPGVVQSILSFAVNADVSIDEVLAKHYPYFLPLAQNFEKIKKLYEDKKRKTNNLDYDDLLVRWIELLEKFPAVRESLSRKFRYVLVDEYQDTNRLQHRLIRLLSGHHGNVLVVGDDAQSIYSFRAANIRNILDFPEHYPNTKIFKLETNYRSTRPILNLANQSIKNNVHQFPKTLHSVLEEGELPQLVRVRDPRQEARFVAQRIVEMQESGLELSQIAVLFRAHYQAAELEMELAKQGIPYLVRGGVRFFEQAHVKDVLAFLRIVQNPNDEIAWVRALMLQPGIGSGFAEKIFDLVEKEDGDLSRVSSPAFGDHALPPKVRSGFLQFKKTLKCLLDDSVRDKPDLLIEEILEHGYNQYALINFDNARDRLDDLRELVNFAHTYKKLKDFLADVTLREGFKGETLAGGGSEEAGEELILSTIHQAKGLEWQAVFILGLSEGTFPHAKSLEKEGELEEERRLFYVAGTRAKKELVLLHSMTRYDYQAGTILCRPSVFIAELPSGTYEEVEVEENAEEETIYLE
jgi:DNA helicase-2/ATP-dependent DNA helicase PcrA